jgi:hypothetical protein
MALRKRKPSLRLRKAGQRLEAMKEIDGRTGKTINYGGDANPLTQQVLEAQIEKCMKQLDEYNGILAEADKKSKEIAADEKKLGEMFTRVLAGGVSIFGVDSDEVGSLGGTKQSERKRHSTGGKQGTQMNTFSMHRIA